MNVIISYDYPATQHIEIWGKIAYYYGNSMDTTKVESHLRSHLEKRGKPRGELSAPTKLEGLDTLHTIIYDDSRVKKKLHTATYLSFRILQVSTSAA